MSRTIKDKDPKFRQDVVCGSRRFIGEAGLDSWAAARVHPDFHSLPKLRKDRDYTPHWMSTPSEWTRLMMNRPMRRKLNTKLSAFTCAYLDGKVYDLLEDFDEEEGYSHKPHQYYW